MIKLTINLTNIEMSKYRIEYCEENGIKVKEFNKYNVNNYTNFLEKKLELHQLKH